jgi:hypothetical protein
MTRCLCASWRSHARADYIFTPVEGVAHSWVFTTSERFHDLVVEPSTCRQAAWLLISHWCMRTLFRPSRLRLLATLWCVAFRESQQFTRCLPGALRGQGDRKILGEPAVAVPGDVRIHPRLHSRASGDGLRTAGRERLDRGALGVGKLDGSVQLVVDPVGKCSEVLSVSIPADLLTVSCQLRLSLRP